MSRDLARALAHCFAMMLEAERRGRTHDVDLWALAVSALIPSPQQEAV
jgi:hypothetical protein